MKSIIGVFALAACVLPNTALAVERTKPAPPPGAVAALDGVPAPGVITNPDWKSRPSAEDVSLFFPPLATLLRIEGRAVISCAVSVVGALRGCTVISETPAGLGFGAAALSMSGRFLMRPATLDGHPVDGGTVRIPINFLLREVPETTAPVTKVASVQALELGRRIARATMHAVGKEAFSEAFHNGLDLDDPSRSDPETRRAAFAAVQAGIEAGLAEGVEIQAGLLADELSVEQMTQVANFLESPAAKAWMETGPVLAKSTPVMALTASRVGREVFCKKVKCEPVNGPPPAAASR